MDLLQPYSYMASDQKGPHLALSFSYQQEGKVIQQVITLDLSGPAGMSGLSR